jgi:hypothetical protein
MKNMEILVKIPLEKWLLRRLRKGWEDNIKVALIKGVWLMIGPSSKTCMLAVLNTGQPFL